MNNKIFEKRLRFNNLIVHSFTSKSGDTFQCVTVENERFLVPKNLALANGAVVELVLVLTSDGYYRTYFNL